MARCARTVANVEGVEGGSVELTIELTVQIYVGTVRHIATQLWVKSFAASELFS